MKRVTTALIGFPLVILLIVLGTPQVINFLLMIVGSICMYEYFNVIKKICKPIQWVGYLSTVIIFLTSILSVNTIQMIVLFGLPIILLALFLHIILSNMKITLKDVAYTLLGIIYISGCIMFLGLITNHENGKYILVYSLLIAWATDVFAFWVGKKFGKHQFSKVSPKKSLEGCIAGAIGAIIVGIIYLIILNNLGVFNLKAISYLYIVIINCILSIISQIGDFIASCIKRFSDSKDYGNLLPGHGGMLDRIDSVIFIAPFIYMIITFIK